MGREKKSIESKIARWGSWLTAANYYAENIIKIKLFIENYTAKSKSKANSDLVTLFNDDSDSLEAELDELKKLAPIIRIINDFEKQGLTMDEQLKLLDEVKEVVIDFPLFNGKLKKVLSKNPDLVSFTTNLDFGTNRYRKYCPLVTVDVERSFSIYNTILTDRRHSLLDSTLKYLVIVKFNQFLA